MPRPDRATVPASSVPAPPARAPGGDPVRPSGPAPAPEPSGVVDACPNCGAPMVAIRGSKQAICRTCGFKDSCCF